jgi:hypothetical protein
MKGGVASLIGMTPNGSQLVKLRLTSDIVLGKRLSDSNHATSVKVVGWSEDTGTPQGFGRLKAVCHFPKRLAWLPQ